MVAEYVVYFFLCYYSFYTIILALVIFNRRKGSVFVLLLFLQCFLYLVFINIGFYSDWVIIFREQRISQNCTGQYVVNCETCFWGSDAWLKLIVYEKKNFSESKMFKELTIALPDLSILPLSNKEAL